MRQPPPHPSCGSDARNNPLFASAPTQADASTAELWRSRIGTRNVIHHAVAVVAGRFAGCRGVTGDDLVRRHYAHRTVGLTGHGDRLRNVPAAGIRRGEAHRVGGYGTY